VRFQLITAASMKIRTFWNVASCSLVGLYRRLRGVYCLHNQGDEWKQYAPPKRLSTPTIIHGATSQKALIF
jgi:hypothetical protein